MFWRCGGRCRRTLSRAAGVSLKRPSASGLATGKRAASSPVPGKGAENWCSRPHAGCRSCGRHERVGTTRDTCTPALKGAGVFLVGRDREMGSRDRWRNYRPLGVDHDFRTISKTMFACGLADVDRPGRGEPDDDHVVAFPCCSLGKQGIASRMGDVRSRRCFEPGVKHPLSEGPDPSLKKPDALEAGIKFTQISLIVLSICRFSGR